MVVGCIVMSPRTTLSGVLLGVRELTELAGVAPYTISRFETEQGGLRLVATVRLAARREPAQNPCMPRPAPSNIVTRQLIRRHVRTGQTSLLALSVS